MCVRFRPPPSSTADICSEQFRTVEEQQQHRILEAVFAHPVTPCPLAEAPKLSYRENMAIIISEEKADEIGRAHV